MNVWFRSRIGEKFYTRAENKNDEMHIDVLIVKNLGLGFENLEIFEEEEELTVNK